MHSRSRFFRDLFQFLHYERMLKKVGIGIASITQQTGDDAAGEMASKLFSLLIVRGSHWRLADAIGLMEKRKLGEVPSFVNDWRARQDLNPRPLGS